MNFDPVLLHARSAAMKAQGFWRDLTLEHHFMRALETHPERVAIAAYRDGVREPLHLTYRQLEERVGRAAAALRAMGIGAGDVVAFQLPNCWEFVVLTLACVRIGAVANPLMTIFRERELEFMLNFGGAKIFVVPRDYRGFDYVAQARNVLRATSGVERLIVTDGAGDDGFDQALLGATATVPASGVLGADEPCLLMYTSGTTGEPKGVVHTSNTLMSNFERFIERLELDGADVCLSSSPFAHLTGFGYLVCVPLMLATKMVIQDIWDPLRALDMARAEGVTYSMASTPFLADLCRVSASGGARAERFKLFCCGGAPVPPVLIGEATRILGMTVCSAWGMTENGAITITEPARALEKSASTDGRALPGIEVKVIDDDGERQPPGVPGRLLARGASLFAGYLKRPQLNNTDADGWFDTGDLATMDADGYIRIQGRTKDLIIRGGENIPVVEVENILYRHPAIASVAIVGYPDERLGERACAYVTLKPGSHFDLAEMSRYLDDGKVAKPYWPERLVVMDDLPRTPSGKIQKFRLRALVREARA